MGYVPINQDFFTSPLEPFDQVRLKGSRCTKCGEVFLGVAQACGNCMGSEMDDVVLSNRGKIFSFTTVWHRPSGDYKGPDPFQPLSIGLIELPDGVRVLSLLSGRPVDQYVIGADVELVVEPMFTDDDGQEVVIYKFNQL